MDSTGACARGRSRAWSWAVAVALTLLVMVAVLLAIHPRYFVYGDTQAAYYGWWHELGARVRAGEWPLLDVHTWRAGNIAADGQWGTFSPLVIGIGVLATLCPSALWFATGVKVALALAGALGTFAVVRSYGAPAPAAYVAGVAVPTGGMTQYLDLPSWAAGLMIWAIFPWVWVALRRTMRGGNPFPAILAGYLLVTVGYVYGTIMLILLLGACLLDCRAAGDRAALRRVLGVGVLNGLVAVAVYLPGVLTASVSVRDSGFGGLGGKFSTDPLAVLSSMLPTDAVPGTSNHLLPYHAMVWFLPLLVAVDWRALRTGWRPLAGLLGLTTLTLVVVDGVARLGPLRWPLRLQPFLVLLLAVAVVVLLTRFRVPLVSARRLGIALGWVLLAGVAVTVRAPDLWGAHVLGVLLVGAAVALAWFVVRRELGLPLAAAAGGAVTLLAFGLQHGAFPDPPSPERNLPAAVADYRTQLGGARGDVVVLGDVESLVEEEPAATRELLVGSAWYLNPHPVQNTYTTVSNDAYYDRYCMHYEGVTCPEALPTLFSREPVTGERRVDLLGISTIAMVRRDFTDRRLQSPPPGWHVARSSRWTVTWVRDDPVPGAGRPVWTSRGTHVAGVTSDDREVSFRVRSVPARGGQVVLSRIAWPGYRTDTGSFADPVDDYLLTLDLPADAGGHVVHVRFAPPRWWLELSCWWLGVLGGLGWSATAALKRRGASRSRSTRSRARRTSAAATGR